MPLAHGSPERISRASAELMHDVHRHSAITISHTVLMSQTQSMCTSRSPEGLPMLKPCCGEAFLSLKHAVDQLR